jgi:hypothetical protein
MTSKSELKRLCTLDPQEMAKRLALAERVIEAVKARNKAIELAESGETYGFDVADAMEAEAKAIAEYDNSKKDPP